MKIILNSNELMNGLNKVGKGVLNSSDSNLSGVFIKTEKCKMILRTTNLDLSIETTVAAEIFEEGEALVNFRIFTEMIKTFSNGDVTLEITEEKMLNVTFGKSSFSIVSLNANEFPKFPGFTDKEVAVTYTLNQFALRKAINSVKFATVKNGTNLITEGVLFELKDNLLTLVALDGYRLAINKIDADCNKDNTILVNAEYITSIAALLDDGEVQIYVTDNHIVFKLDNLTIMCRLMQGNSYPNYTSLISSDSKFSVNIIRKEFLDALERAILITRKTEEFIKLVIGNEKIKILANSSIAKSVEEVPASINGLKEEFTIAFNGRYLIDVFKNTDYEDYILHFNTNVSPVLINGKDKEDKELFLVLPIRLQTVK